MSTTVTTTGSFAAARQATLARLRHWRPDLYNWARTGLGAIWLLDGLLQLQSYMFSRQFGSQVIAPSAAGQPGWVASGVLWSAHLIATHAVLANAAFASVQLLIGITVLVPRTVKLGLIISMPWAIGVWYFGEGLGGVASGTGNLVTGTPGAVVLYLFVAVTLLSLRRSRGDGRLVARSLWFVAWVGGAALAVSGAQYSSGAQRALFSEGASAAPWWLSSFVRQLGHLLSGPTFGFGLLAIEVVVGATALGGPAVRRWGAYAGAVLAVCFWVFGEGLGQLFTGSATDPNSGPLLVLMAFALAAGAFPATTTRRTWNGRQLRDAM